MGDLAVQALADLLAKKEVAPLVDTGALLATKANMDEPAVKSLLQ
jgi:ABC-type sugar transport system substrate-binding protein